MFGFKREKPADTFMQTYKETMEWLEANKLEREQELETFQTEMQQISQTNEDSWTRLGVISSRLDKVSAQLDAFKKELAKYDSASVVANN